MGADSLKIRNLKVHPKAASIRNGIGSPTGTWVVQDKCTAAGERQQIASEHHCERNDNRVRPVTYDARAYNRTPSAVGT